VACTRYCTDVVPQVADGSRLILADSWTAHTEQIVSAQPDLVIASVPYQEKAVSEILKAGTRFLGLAPRTLADIYTDIATIAGVVGAKDRGEAVIAAMQRRIDEVRSRTSTSARPRVWCEEWGKPIIASQPWVAELVEVAGGCFVGRPGQTITAQEVASAEPDVILAAWCGAGDRVPLEKIVEQRGWTELSAVRGRRVFCIRDELLNTPATSLIGGLHAIAWALHPELFPRPHGIRQLRTVI
jgi:iron complex transport system substrate-binding protein